MARRVAKVAAAVAMLEGTIVLGGWAFDARSVTSVLPGHATMKPNTALAFVLGGTALWLSLRGGRAQRGVAIVSSATVFAVGALTLSEPASAGRPVSTICSSGQRCGPRDRSLPAAWRRRRR